MVNYVMHEELKMRFILFVNVIYMNMFRKFNKKCEDFELHDNKEKLEYITQQ